MEEKEGHFGPEAVLAKLKKRLGTACRERVSDLELCRKRVTSICEEDTRFYNMYMSDLSNLWRRENMRGGTPTCNSVNGPVILYMLVKSHNSSVGKKTLNLMKLLYKGLLNLFIFNI
jgi:hypothetical protein